VNPQVHLLLSLRLLLLTHVHLVLVVDKLDDRSPSRRSRTDESVRGLLASQGEVECKDERVSVVDVVSEARGVDDGQLDLEALLLKLHPARHVQSRNNGGVRRAMAQEGGRERTSALMMSTSVVLSSCLAKRAL
jgi:hypothetical protein